MVLMTKFDESSTASRWLCMLKKELGEELSPDVWLARADARLCSRATSWAEQTPEVIQILVDSNIENATSEDKNTFMKLLVQEFLSDPRNIVIDDQASTEVANLAQREDKDLYTYYGRTEKLLKGIHGWDQVTINGRKTVTLSLPEQQLLKDTIIKFILGFKNSDLQFRIVEYRTNLTPSLYGAYKFAESALAILHIQTQMQDNREQQQRYEVSKSF